MANLITLGRLIAMFIVIAVAYTLPPAVQLANVVLLAIVFVADGLDGYVARKRHETSVFGAIFDIAVDRIVELSLWVALADLDMVPLWVPLLFVVRGSIVDAIRAGQAAEHRRAPFELMHSALGRWLVAGRFMRGFYAVWKAVTFVWLFAVLPLPSLAPHWWQAAGATLIATGTLLTWGAALLCVVRGMPVIAEFLMQHFALKRTARAE